MRYITAFFIAISVSLFLTPLCIYFGKKFKLYDNPETTDRKIHKKIIPHTGGFAIFIAFLVTYFTVTPAINWWLVSCASVIFTVGFIDDFINIRAILRLVIQVLVSCALVYGLKLDLQQIIITPSLSVNLPFIFGFGLSVFILIGAINSINMIDGMDGLAGGVVVFGLATLSVLHYLINQDMSLLYILTIPLIGSILGFLKFNTNPASIFMGDGGSNLIGFLTGFTILGVLNRYSADFHVLTKVTSIPLISAILCIGVPVVDTAIVVLKRLRAKVHPMSADRRHFHHFLLNLGLTQHQCVTSIYFLGLISALVGIIPNIYPRFNLWWIPYVYMLIMCGFFFIANFKSDFLVRFLSDTKFMENKETRYSAFLKKWRRINRYVVYGVLLFSPLLSGIVSKEISYVAFFSAIWIGISLFFKPNQYDVFTKIIATLAIFSFIFLVNQNSMRIALFGEIVELQKYYNYIFIFLFVSTLFYFVVSISTKSIIISMYDFVLLGIPFLTLLVNEPYYSKYALGTVSLRCFVVFFVMRTFFGKKVEGYYRLRLIIFIGLIYISLTSGLDFRIVY